MKKSTFIAGLGLAMVIAFSSSYDAKALIKSSKESIYKDEDSNGNVTYINRANGKTYTEYADGRTEGDRDYLYNADKVVRSETVEIGNFKEISVRPDYGQTTITKPKVVKGKDIISARISYKEKSSGFKVPVEKDENGNYYYLDRVTGERKYTGGQDIYTDLSEYKIRVYGKKLGTATLKFKIKDASGKTVETKKIKINVVKNGAPVISATFGGKSLILDNSKGSAKKNYIYNNGTRYGAEYTTKKSGKFKVKLNKNYKLKGIYVSKRIKELEYHYDQNDPGEYYTSYKYEPLDLNGDGDYNDVIDGIEESVNGMYYYQKIRNGQKVILDNEAGYRYLSEKVSDSDKNFVRRQVQKEKNDSAYTYFIVIYQDKRNGEFHSQTIAIAKR